MRLRMGKLCLSALRLKGNWVSKAPLRGDAPEKLDVFRRENQIDPGAQHRDGAAFRAQGPLVRRRVNAARPAADDGDPGVSQLVGDLARDFDAVMRRHARADHGHGVLVARGQAAQDVEEHGRIVNLPEQRRIILVGLEDDVAAGLLDAFEFAAEVHVLLPIGDGLGNFRPDAVDLLEFGAAGAEDGCGIAEALQQLPDAHRTEAVNHIQSDKGFPAIHAGKETPFSPGRASFTFAVGATPPSPRSVQGDKKQRDRLAEDTQEANARQDKAPEVPALTPSNEEHPARYHRQRQQAASQERPNYGPADHIDRRGL